jgi:murein DD-endopeptidase MepM/ murein hydrolase activator NlpD
MALNNDAVELKDDNGDDILEYEVVSGDNISSIAERFNVSVDTILWANDLNSKSSIKVGQKLVILPVSGISYKVKSGDTLSGLSARFNVNERDIVGFNKTNGDKLIIGENIIIPGGKISSSPSVTTKVTTSKTTGNNSPKANVAVSGGMVKPINGIKTQGVHGNNGVDFGANIGTPVYSVLDGVVTLTRGGNSWNGGYGNYVVIKHSNGIQTLYAHLSSINVSKGQSVEKGQFIANSGNSGQSTGPHLHFEVRGAKNPF